MTEPPPNQYTSYLAALDKTNTHVMRFAGVLGRLGTSWLDFGEYLHSVMSRLTPEERVLVATKLLVVNNVLDEIKETTELIVEDIGGISFGVGEIIRWIQKELNK